MNSVKTGNPIEFLIRINNLLVNTNVRGDYNLYLHKIYDFDENGRQRLDTRARNNMYSILKTGLSKSKYSSLLQTATFAGELNSEKTSTAVNYDYPWNVTEQIVVVLGLPRYVEIYGKKIDFSTPRFGHAEYGNGIKDHQVGQYTTPFDALKLFSVPTEFIVGAFVTKFPHETHEDFMARGGEYELITNEKHISNLSEEEQEKIMAPYVDRMITLFDLKEEDTEEEMNLKVYNKLIEMDQVNFNAGTAADDFDID